MNDPKIGQILTGNEERDAIHVAIYPAFAADELYRGAEVGPVYGTKDQMKHMDSAYGFKPIGIVDPFLKEYSVKKGQRFYVFLFPGTVDGMRHHWSHPVIDGPTPKPKNESELWLRNFAEKWNFDYDEMIRGAQKRGGYVQAMGIDLHGRGELEPGDEKLFWKHIETLTGKKYSEEHREDFGWSCSC